jgi:hypothetical protein
VIEEHTRGYSYNAVIAAGILVHFVFGGCIAKERTCGTKKDIVKGVYLP